MYLWSFAWFPIWSLVDIVFLVIWRDYYTHVHLNSIFHKNVWMVQIISYLTDNTLWLSLTLRVIKIISHILWILYTINVYIWIHLFEIDVCTLALDVVNKGMRRMLNVWISREMSKTLVVWHRPRYCIKYFSYLESWQVLYHFIANICRTTAKPCCHLVITLITICTKVRFYLLFICLQFGRNFLDWP